MNRRTPIITGGVVALLLGLLGYAGLHWLAGRSSPGPRVEVAGGDGGGLPRARPDEEHIDATALERATQDRAAEALQALVIVRHGHIVFERYGHGLSGDTVIDGGAFARVLVAMAAGVAARQGALEAAQLRGFDPQALRAAIESGAQQRYALYLSRNVWSPTNAAAAWIALPAPAAPTPADCCLHARLLDWMRIAILLVDDGRFEGRQILPAGWVQRLQRPNAPDSVSGLGVELAAAAHAAEPFAASGVFFLRGPGRWRLWLVPSLQLAVLFGAAAPSADAAATAGWDETRLPNLVIRALSDRPVQPGDASDLQRLVPGH